MVSGGNFGGGGGCCRSVGIAWLLVVWFQGGQGLVVAPPLPFQAHPFRIRSGGTGWPSHTVPRGLFFGNSDTATTTSDSPDAPATTVPTIVRKKRRRKKKVVYRWDRMMASLQRYHARRGHARVRLNDDPALYRWVCSVRRTYKQNYKQLSSHQLAQLAALDFCWDVPAFVWDRQLARLREYYNRHGHANVPAHYEHNLGVWVRNQRREYRKLQLGQRSTLTATRLQQLQAVDFAFGMRHDDAWQQRLNELGDFVRVHGHAHVPQQDGNGLGTWCMNQRTQYKQYRKDAAASSLSAARIRALEQLGFCWNVPDMRWTDMLTRLQAYHERCGHVRIAPNDTANADLKVWLWEQRYQFRRRQQGHDSALTNDRIARIKSTIPNFRWKLRGLSPSKDDWEKLFDAMRAQGLKPGMPAKSHWFAGGRDGGGNNNDVSNGKDVWTPEDLLALWNADGENIDGEQS